jgi:hypothetical protein
LGEKKNKERIILTKTIVFTIGMVKPKYITTGDIAKQD